MIRSITATDRVTLAATLIMIFYPTTLICVLSDIKSAVSLFLSRDRYIGDGDTDRLKVCMMAELYPGPGQYFSPSAGNIFRALQMRGKKWLSVNHFWPLRHRFLPFDREYLENGKLQRYMLNYSLTSARLELLKWRYFPIKPNMLHFTSIVNFEALQFFNG